MFKNMCVTDTVCLEPFSGKVQSVSHSSCIHMEPDVWPGIHFYAQHSWKQNESLSTLDTTSSYLAYFLQVLFGFLWKYLLFQCVR